MFNLSGSELIFLVLIALVVLGPDKLPEAMRKAGKAYADFKKLTTGFQSEMKSVLDEPMRELRETAELAKSSTMFDANARNAGTRSASPPTDSAAPPVQPRIAAPIPDARQNIEEALARLEVKNAPVASGVAGASAPPETPSSQDPAPSSHPDVVDGVDDVGGAPEQPGIVPGEVTA